MQSRTFSFNSLYLRGKIAEKQAEIKVPELKPADRAEEMLMSNLFEVTKFPPTIFSSPTEIRRVSDVYAKLGPDVADYSLLLYPRDSSQTL